MIFKPKFFLDLSGDSSDKPAAPAKVGPIREAKPAAKDAKASAAPVAAGPAPTAAPSAALAAVGEGAAPAPAPVSGGLTTVEAIAAELAAAQANRPAPSLATFAADGHLRAALGEPFCQAYLALAPRRDQEVVP